MFQTTNQSSIFPIEFGPRTVQRLYFTVSSWSSSIARLQCPGVFAATTKVRKTIALMLRKEIYLRAVTCPEIGGCSQLSSYRSLGNWTSNDQFPSFCDHYALANNWSITLVNCEKAPDVTAHHMFPQPSLQPFPTPGKQHFPTI